MSFPILLLFAVVAALHYDLSLGSELCFWTKPTTERLFLQGKAAAVERQLMMLLGKHASSPLWIQFHRSVVEFV